MLVKMVDKFNKENTDGIKVKMDISSDLDSQLSTAFAAGEGPTMILSSSAYRFTYGDYLQDVSLSLIHIFSEAKVSGMTQTEFFDLCKRIYKG